MCFDGRKEAGRRAKTRQECAINASVCFFSLMMMIVEKRGGVGESGAGRGRVGRWVGRYSR